MSAYKRGVKAIYIARMALPGEADVVRLLSYCPPAFATLQYFLGRAVRPVAGKGPLAVFVDRESAQWALDERSSDIELYECIYWPSECRCLFVSDADGRKTIRRRLPPGTDFADEVTLLRRLA